MGMARPQEPFLEARPAAPPPACWPQQGFQLPTEGRPSLLQLSLLQARGPFQVVEAAVQAGQLRGTMAGGALAVKILPQPHVKTLGPGAPITRNALCPP